MKGRTLRKNLDKKIHNEYSKEICSKLSRYIKDKKVIMLYNAIDGEVDVSFLRSETDKTFLFPRVEGNNIVAVYGNEFICGSFKIQEPTGEPFKGNIDAVIVPMCAFDRKLNRLGFGKGFYDRFLKNNNCLKIGVAFSCQETEDIIVKDTDVKMDIIITEKEII